MFTGIIEGLGSVYHLDGSRLVVAPPPGLWDHEPFAMGESVAVNGCCLTVVGFDQGLHFDLSEETFRRTSLGQLIHGSPVNLERAMKLGDRFGGHLVQGHVDAVATLVEREDREEMARYRFEVPTSGTPYLCDKGSIALDGVSLTIVEPAGSQFDVWLIPHTLEVTNLGTANPGQAFNVEYDVVAKHIERLFRTQLEALKAIPAGA